MSARRFGHLAGFVIALALIALLAWLTSRSLTAPSVPSHAESSPAPSPELRAPSRPGATHQPRVGTPGPSSDEPASERPSAERAAPLVAAERPPAAAPPRAAAPAAPAVAASHAVEAEPDEPDTLRFEINKEGIRSAIDAVLPDLQACYEGWLQVGKPVRGKVRVSLRIEADRDDPQRGVITAAEVLDSELHHPLIEACLLNALSQPEFDPPEGGGKVMVTYPLVFDDEDPE